MLAAAVALGPRVLSRGRGAGPPLGFSPPSWGAVRGSGRGEKEDAAPARHPCPTPPAGEAREADAEETRAAKGVRSWLPQLIAVGVVAVVFAHWGLTSQRRAGSWRIQLRLALVPPAVRDRHCADALGDAVLPPGDGVHELVLPAELGTAARDRDPDRPPRHALVVRQLRLAGDRLPLRLVHRQAVRARAAERRGRRDRAGEPHARGARAGRRQERPDGGGPAARRDRDPGQPRDASPAGGVGKGSPGGAASCFSPQPHSRTGAELRGEKPSPGRGPLPHDRTRGRNAPTGRRRPRSRPRGRHEVDRGGDGGGAHRRGRVPGAVGPALAGIRLVVRSSPRRWRLLVPAQPDRRRQPAAPARESRADRAAPPGASAERPSRLQRRPLRDRHDRLARILRPWPAQCLRPALAARDRRRGRERRPAPAVGPSQAAALARSDRPRRPPRLPLHSPQRRRRRGRPGRLRDQHPLRDPSPACRPDPAARGACPILGSRILFSRGWRGGGRVSRGWRGEGVPGWRGVLFLAPTTTSDGRGRPRRETQRRPGAPSPRQDPRAKRMVPMGLGSARCAAARLGGHGSPRCRPARPRPAVRLAGRAAGRARPGRPAAVAAARGIACSRDDGVRRPGAGERRDRLSRAARLPARPLPQRRSRDEHPGDAPRLRLPLGARRPRRPRRPRRARPPASSSTASTGPTSPTGSATWASRRPHGAFDAISDLPPSSAPRSTPPTSTTSSPRPSSTSSTPASRSPRRRPAGCAASRR